MSSQVSLLTGKRLLPGKRAGRLMVGGFGLGLRQCLGANSTAAAQDIAAGDRSRSPSGRSSADSQAEAEVQDVVDEVESEGPSSRSRAAFQ